MGFEIELKMKTTKEIVKVRGLGEKGDVQKFVDAECIRHMDPYTPMLNGALTDSVIIGSVIGSGELVYNSPYARYQYYGKLMVDPETGSPFAGKGVKKVLTDKDLVHDKSKHPQAGPFWFERMKADHKQDILDGARKLAGAK